MTKTCLFCPSELNGSNEHIIPESINGRLQTRKLICSNCNNKFGVRIDPSLKESLKVVLHALRFKNSKILAVMDQDGASYLIDQKGTLKPLKTEVKVSKEGGKTILSVSGQKDRAIRALATKAARTFSLNALKKATYTLEDKVHFNTELSTDVGLEISQEVLLSILKIIVEFYAYKNLPMLLIEDIRRSVAELSDEFTNKIQICSQSLLLRDRKNNEISHLIVIKKDNESQCLLAYVELFNVICARFTLVPNYEGPDVEEVYHQDAVTGEVLPNSITIQESGVINHSETLLNQFFDRLVSRQINDDLELGIKQIKANLRREVQEGKLAEDAFEKKAIEVGMKLAADLMVNKYSDYFDDFTEEELKKINYKNSLVKAAKKGQFLFFYHQMINHEFFFEGEDTIFKMQEFCFKRHKPRNEEKMLKAYCCFVSPTGTQQYLLAYDVFFFIGIPFPGLDAEWL